MGATVAIPAPAGPVPKEAFELGLGRLHARYRVVYDEELFARSGFLAGDDDRRAAELNRYFADPDVRAIICARGGYGVTRILDRLDADALRRDPKPVVGFSDITALLGFCVTEARIRPIHGPVVTQLGRLPDEDVSWLFRLLEDPVPVGTFAQGRVVAGEMAGGRIEGRLVGGNLELVTRLIGTPWELDLKDALFVIEDQGERPYRVDRMLTQLRLASCLEETQGVLVGDMVGCEEPGGAEPSAMAVIEERVRAFGLPGVFGLPIGHGARNLAFPVGAKAAVDVGSGEVVFLEAAVS